MKKLGIAAVCLAAGCAVALSGCSSCAGSSQNVVYLSSNWYANTGFKKFQPTFVEGNEEYKTGEEIIYDVKFDGSAASNSTYSVSYLDGTYTTVFHAATIEKSSDIIREEFKSGYPDGKITVYYYKTILVTGDVTFKFGDKTQTFPGGESKVTESYFLSVEDRLRPVYSYQKINSATPATLQATSLESTYELQNYEYETFYSYDGKQAVTLENNDGVKSEKKAENLDGTANTMFDLAYLDIAVRACKLSASLSQQITLYTPHSGICDFTLSGSSRALGDEEKKDITAELKDSGLYVPFYYKDENGQQAEKGLDTVAISVNYNAELTGVSQTYWFAGIGNAQNNVGRATMLKIEYPLNFSLGTLNYTLKSVESTLWNGKN